MTGTPLRNGWRQSLQVVVVMIPILLTLLAVIYTSTVKRIDSIEDAMIEHMAKPYHEGTVLFVQQEFRVLQKEGAAREERLIAEIRLLRSELTTRLDRITDELRKERGE